MPRWRYEPDGCKTLTDWWLIGFIANPDRRWLLTPSGLILTTPFTQTEMSIVNSDHKPDPLLRPNWVKTLEATAHGIAG